MTVTMAVSLAASLIESERVLVALKIASGSLRDRHGVNVTGVLGRARVDRKWGVVRV
jgi:hypothetical protein